MRIRWFRGPRALVFAAALFTLALAISCGSAAPPEPATAEQGGGGAPDASQTGNQPAEATSGQANQAAPAAGGAPTATPAPAAAVRAESTVTRMVESQGEIQQETNLHCAGTRPIVSQFRPYVEMLVDADVHTGQFVPWLAERWESSPDTKSWTFHLRKGVPFPFDYGELTAKDIANIASAKAEEGCLSSTAAFWRNMDRVEIIDDYTLTFHMKDQALTLIDVVSSLPTGAELFALSKAQLDEVGPENMDSVKPAGTSYYQYLERKLG